MVSGDNFESMSNMNPLKLEHSSHLGLSNSNVVNHQSVQPMGQSSDNRFSYNPLSDMSLLNNESSMGKMYMNYSDNQSHKEKSFGYSKQSNPPKYTPNPPINPSSHISYPEVSPVVPSQAFTSIRPPSGFGVDNSLELLYNLMSINLFLYNI